MKHMYIEVDSDQMVKERFEGTLADFAASKLSEQLKPGMHAITVESSCYETEMRPRMDNSSTWYKKKVMRLSVWYEDDKVRSAVDGAYLESCFQKYGHKRDDLTGHGLKRFNVELEYKVKLSIWAHDDEQASDIADDIIRGDAGEYTEYDQLSINKITEVS